MTDTEIIEVLQRTRERLFQVGWMKGDVGDPVNGPNCLVGAIFAASGWNWLEEADITGRRQRAMQPVSDAIKGTVDMPAVTFNDRSSTTFDDIIDAIDLTIKGLE